MMELYENIKHRREELGLSQQDLADMLGYKSRSTIAKIEAGENDIPQSKIKAFAIALKTTPAILMGWVNDTDIPQWYSSDALTSTKLHDGTIDLVNKIRLKYPNDIVISKLSSNITLYLRHIDNLLESNSQYGEYVNTKFPDTIAYYYLLNTEGKELLDGYAKMLFDNEKYKSKRDLAKLASQDDFNKLGLFYFIFGENNKKSE